MFDSKYYKNRYIYELENGYKAMIELNLHRCEYFYFLPNNESKDGYDIFLRKLRKNPLQPEKIESLGTFLETNGYTDKDFASPFKRTKKIVSAIDLINKLDRAKTKTK